jgi:Spy/CpxP family protein refolding chaperone
METSTPSTSNARRNAILLVAVAFVAGALIGFAGGRVYSIFHGPLRGRGPEFMRGRIVSHLDHELNLTSQQHDQIAQIMDRHHKRMMEISGGIQPHMRQEIDAANREIEAVLTPEQRKKFETMRMRMQRFAPHRIRGREDGPLPPPPGF